MTTKQNTKLARALSRVQRLHGAGAGAVALRDDAIRTLAERHARPFERLGADTARAVATQFAADMADDLDHGSGDAAVAHDHAFHCPTMQDRLSAGLDARVTGGADWSVDSAAAIVCNDDEEGLFLLIDDGSWSVVARFNDETDPSGARIIPLVDWTADWRIPVAEALRLAKAAGPRYLG